MLCTKIFLFSTFGFAIDIVTIVSELGYNVKHISFKSLVELFFIVIVSLIISTII